MTVTNQPLRDGGHAEVLAANNGFTTEKEFVSLADGASGSVALEREWLKCAFSAYRMFCDKQRDYGCGNIAKFGQQGVLVRANDKIERMSNLLKTREEPKNEPLFDSWLDLANYGMIGMIVYKGHWPGADNGS